MVKVAVFMVGDTSICHLIWRPYSLNLLTNGSLDISQKWHITELFLNPHRFIFSSQGLQCTYRLLLVLSNQLRINKVMFCGKFRWSPADRAGDLSLRKKKKKKTKLAKEYFNAQIKAQAILITFSHVNGKEWICQINGILCT